MIPKLNACSCGGKAFVCEDWHGYQARCRECGHALGQFEFPDWAAKEWNRRFLNVEVPRT